MFTARQLHTSEMRQPIGVSFSQPQPLVYLAEDDDDIRETLAALFAHDGFDVRSAADGTSMLDWLLREREPGMRQPDVIVTDHRMPGYCSLDILECLTELEWTVPVLVITAYGPEVRELARSYGARAVFEKPFDPDELRVAAKQCINWDTRHRGPRHRWSTGPAHDVINRAREALYSGVDRGRPS